MAFPGMFDKAIPLVFHPNDNGNLKNSTNLRASWKTCNAAFSLRVKVCDAMHRKFETAL